MSAAHDTYRATCASAEKTKVNSVAAAIATHQVTIDASNSVAGYNLQTGNYANLAAAVRSANAAKLAALQDAERIKQQAIDQARDVLRAAGGESFF